MVEQDKLYTLKTGGVPFMAWVNPGPVRTNNPALTPPS